MGEEQSEKKKVQQADAEAADKRYNDLNTHDDQFDLSDALLSIAISLLALTALWSEAMGWRTHALVSLFCEGRMAAAEVRSAVADHPEVAAAYTVAGEASAILHVRARDTAHLEQALERIRDTPGIIRTQTQVVLSTLFERPVAG